MDMDMDMGYRLWVDKQAQSTHKCSQKPTGSKAFTLHNQQ